MLLAMSYSYGAIALPSQPILATCTFRGQIGVYGTPKASRRARIGCFAYPCSMP